MNRRSIAIVLAVQGLCMVAAPAMAASSAKTSKPAGTMIYGQPASPACIDPGDAVQDNQTMKVILNTYDSLVGYKYGTYKHAPDAAIRWTNVNNKVWTFYLRPGVKFHTGETLTSQDVAYTIERANALALPISVVTSTIAKVQTPNKTTVKITLTSKNSYFLDDITRLYIVDKKVAAAHATNNDMGHAWLCANEDGSGPYEVTSWNHSSEMDLAYYPKYWAGWSGAHLATVKILYVADPATQQEMMQQGDLDFMAMNLPALDLDVKHHPKQYPDLKLLTGPSFRTDMLTFNTLKSPLNKVKVRQAISLAFPYTDYVKAVTNSFGIVPTGYVPKGFAGFDKSIKPETTNLKKAKTLLAQAGYSNGGFSLTLAYAAPQTSEQEAGLLLQNNLRTLGIGLTLQPTPFATMVQEATKGVNAPDMFALQQVPANADPVNFIDICFNSKLAGKQYNWSYYQNPTVDKLIHQAYAANSHSARQSILDHLQQILVSDAPAVYFGNPGKVELINTRIKGYTPDPLYYWLVHFYNLSGGTK